MLASYSGLKEEEREERKRQKQEKKEDESGGPTYEGRSPSRSISNGMLMGCWSRPCRWVSLGGKWPLIMCTAIEYKAAMRDSVIAAHSLDAKQQLVRRVFTATMMWVSTNVNSPCPYSLESSFA